MADRIDEILGNFGDAPRRKPVTSLSQRINWKPKQFKVPIQQSPSAQPVQSPQGNTELDALLDRIRAEQALPPHKKNEARISELKRQAMELMKRLESQWVKDQADRLLPLVESET